MTKKWRLEQNKASSAGVVQGCTVSLEFRKEYATWTKRDDAWREYDAAAREAELQKDELIDRVVARLQQEIEEETLFTIRWTLTRGVK